MRLYNRHHGDAPIDAVSIMRPGPLGNPVRLGTPCIECGHVHSRASDGTAALVCASRLYYRRLRDDRDFRLDVLSAAGSPGMVCACYPAPCHGDIYLQFAEAYNERAAISGDPGLALSSGLAAVAAQARVWRSESAPSQQALFSL